MTVVKNRFENKDEKFSVEAENFANQYLINFREKQTQPEYQILQNNIYKSKTEFKNTVKLYLKSIKGKLSSKNDFFHGSYSGNVAFEQKTVKGIKKFWRDKPFYAKEKLIDKPYFFYTLHVDPEASTMVVSPYQTNQFAVIEAIAKAKPIDHLLIVKEHLTMIGRRPNGYYDRINALPGVYMVNPLEPSFQFIKGAKAVITLTGTSGLEAIMLNKPALFLGKFLYEWINKGFVCTTDLSRLNEVLTNIETIKLADDALLKRLLMSIYDSSFSFNTSLIWSGVSKTKVEKNPEAVASFTAALHNFLK
jgi:capsule polysaccharide modification protein KpsS